MPRYTLLTDSKRIDGAQRLLDARLAREAGRRRTYTVGFPSGDMQATVRYLPTFEIWHATPVDGLRNRYWNGFGFDDPADSRKALTLTVEINPSFTGSRRCAGLFIEDSRGLLYLGHTGGVGGGRAGVGKHNFLSFLKQREIFDFVGEREDILIGRIDAKDFAQRLAKFASIVRDFKAEVATATKLPNAARQDARVPSAARVAKYGRRGESTEHKRLKLYIGDNPEILGIGDVRNSHVEYAFITGDRVDVMLELKNGIHIVIEVERRGEYQTLVGAHQAIKYRALMAAELGVPLRQVKAGLVAYAIPKKTIAFCQQHGIVSQFAPGDLHKRSRPIRAS